MQPGNQPFVSIFLYRKCSKTNQSAHMELQAFEFRSSKQLFRFIEGAPTSARQSVRELMKLDASNLELAPNGMSSTKRRSTKRGNQSTKPKFVCPILNFHFRIASCKTKLPKNHVGLRRILVARLNLCRRTCSAPNQPMFSPIGCDIL